MIKIFIFKNPVAFKCRYVVKSNYPKLKSSFSFVFVDLSAYDRLLYEAKVLLTGMPVANVLALPINCVACFHLSTSSSTKIF